jgi:NRPS condensation-like uncharacterized protein
MRRKTESSADSVPLNCVDKCLLALDSVNEPMLIYGVLDLEGEIDQVKLNQAILSAQQAHPVMRTVLRSRNFRLFREIQGDLRKGVLSIVDQAQLAGTNEENYLSSWMNQPLDIRKEFPVRVLLLKRNERESSLVFTFHHSAADGLRAFVFIRKVIESYNNELSDDSKYTVDVRINHKGDELLEFAHSQRSKVKHYYRKIVSSLFYRFVIVALPPPTRVFHDRSGQSRELAFCLKVVEPGELKQIQTKARAARVGLNDIFLAACYKTVEKWNSMHGKASKRIRVMVPVNISPEGFSYVISNHVSWCSFTSTSRDRADSAKLLRKVKADTTNAITNGIAFSLIYFFYFCSRFPLFVMREMARFLMITRTYVDTIIITNLGFIWPKSGSEEAAVCNMSNAKILNVTGLAPVITPMGLSIATCTYNRKLSLSLTYRPALLSEEKARMFLDLYVEEIKNYQVGAQGA